MPIVAEEYQFVIGVDTHAASHSFAVIAYAAKLTASGRRAGTRPAWMPSTSPGRRAR